MIEFSFLFQSYLSYLILCPLLKTLFKLNSIIIQLSVFFIISLFNLFFVEYINIISMWINFCVFSFLVCMYIFIYGALETSISIKTLNELDNKKAVLLSYITKKIVEKNLLKRIDTLLKKRMIIKKNDKYSLTVSGQKIVKMIALIRRILKLENLGFYK